MLQVGITGGIGTGKSTVCKIFACLGIPILDTDALAKSLMQTNGGLQKKMQKNFGNDIFENKILNKKLLAKKAFDTQQHTELLNSIVHPFVFEAIDVWQNKQNGNYTIRESALLIETGSYKKLDIIVGVCAPTSLRIQRVLDRNVTLSIADIKAIMNKQMSEHEKQAFYQYTIYNDGEQLLIPQVLALHHQIMNQL